MMHTALQRLLTLRDYHFKTPVLFLASGFTRTCLTNPFFLAEEPLDTTSNAQFQTNISEIPRAMEDSDPSHDGHEEAKECMEGQAQRRLWRQALTFDLKLLHVVGILGSIQPSPT